MPRTIEPYMAPRELYDRTARVRCAKRKKIRADRMGHLTEAELDVVLPLGDEERARRRVLRP